MGRRLAIAAVALAGLLGGCGNSSSPRATVASYIRQVDVIEAALTPPLSAVTRTGAQFASQQRTGAATSGDLLARAQSHALTTARAQILALRRRLAAITAPAAAEHLRALLMTLISRQAALTGEVAKMIVFVPRFGTALTPLAPATTALQTALGVSQPQGYGWPG